jgi:hypothetical protein
MLWYSERDYKR